MKGRYKAEKWLARRVRAEVVESEYGIRLQLDRVDPYRPPDVELLVGPTMLVELVRLLRGAPGWPELVQKAAEEELQGSKTEEGAADGAQQGQRQGQAASKGEMEAGG